MAPATGGVGLRMTVFIVSLLPGLIAFLPGFYRAVWNFADPVQQTYLTSSRVAMLAFVLAAVFAPFVAAVTFVALARARGLSWSDGFRTGSIWAFVLGCFALFTMMVTGGGF